MLRPYSNRRAPRARCALDGWAGEGWTLLERHALAVASPPEVALSAALALRLSDLPAVRALFTLRRLGHAPDQALRDFFSAAPFAMLADEPGREWVFGVQRPAAARHGPAAFAGALAAAEFAAVGNFRAEPRDGGALLWTETWVRTRGRRAGLAFGAYWLAIGPFSAWIRRMILRAARARAERVDGASPGPARPGARPER
ncbi:hypothetical protein [Anaeromyxobacter sp. PSR-1]|uniref:hypothetical protein n=1 Tax=unclassified Anaeromyxobacter TaxID=2620896 RepID=UPI0005E76A56|nr:hypothetical protein [Anaeromyxobacter sp. PSR-1]GAO02038.1 hypothetical protein PSR1_00905 [Anaeromyxobacter sp. PSR-1]